MATCCGVQSCTFLEPVLASSSAAVAGSQPDAQPPTCSYTLERQPPESEERVSPGQGMRCDVEDGRLANAAYADRAVLLIRWPEPPRLEQFNSSSACGVAQRTSAGPRGVDLHRQCCGSNRCNCHDCRQQLNSLCMHAYIRLFMFTINFSIRY